MGGPSRAPHVTSLRALAVRAQAPIETAPLVREARPEPSPGPGEILVRVAACGICRTDLHVVEGDLPLVTAPIVPGHQVVGRVVGEGARFRAGDRVGIAWLRHTCGVCAACAGRRENLCERARFTGWHADGGFADYAVVSEDFAYALPDALTDVETAPLLCAGIIGYRALRLSAVAPGGRLGIYGFGSSASVTIQVARARGCEVYVCTREPSHRELARAMGAAWAGEAGDRMPVPVDGAIIFAPAGELVPVALRSLARGGTLALAGIYMTTIPSLDYERDLFQERRITSVSANTRTDGRELLAEAARIPIRPVVTTFPMDDANRALLDLKRGAFAGSGVLVNE
jgi:propanol-preferring alcohol dehydrogenase